MRTTLNLDADILSAAMELMPGKTKTQVINEALRAFAIKKRRLQLLELRGQITWDGNIDELRKRT